MTTIDELVAGAAPITDDDLQGLRVEELEGELCAAIMREPRRVRRRRRLPSRARLRVAGAIAVAACAALVLAGSSLLGSERGGTTPAFAAEAVRVANAVPRLLIDAPGWKVQRADEFTVGTGEMTFSNGDREVDLRWNAGSGGADGLVTDRANSADLKTTSVVLGHRARVFRYAQTGGDFTALWVQGGYRLELRGGLGADASQTLAEYEQLLHALRPASVDEWLSAMPASVVLPVDQEEVVRKMLADIPVPDGFDVAALSSRAAVHDRYQLGARVAGTAACAWIAQWARARRDGDRAAAEQAVAAMKTSRDWAILREMWPEAAFPRVVWQYADAIAGPGTVVGGRVLTVEESYGDALC